MKLRSLPAITLVLVFSAVLLCSCGSSIPKVTVISKQSVNNTTQTTTTATVTTTTTTIATTTTSSAVSSETTTSRKPTGPDTVIVPDSFTESGNSAIGDAIADLAKALLFTPYEAGKSGPDSFDNPGLVVYCYGQNGFTVPRKAKAMAEYGKEVYPDEIQPGDILLFCNEVGEEISFAGIYIGDNRFIASNNPQTPTLERRLDTAYWVQRFVMARRFVQE